MTTLRKIAYALPAAIMCLIGGCLIGHVSNNFWLFFLISVPVFGVIILGVVLGVWGAMKMEGR